MSNLIRDWGQSYKREIVDSRVDVRILTFSNSQLYDLNNRIGKIQDGTFKIVHVIELQKYAYVANTFKNKKTSSESC